MEATVSCLLMLQKNINFKAKNREIKEYALCLSNISKEFTINNLEKKTGLKGVVELFSVDFNNILDIHKCLMKRT